jgi:hypothetical protein
LGLKLLNITVIIISNLRGISLQNTWYIRLSGEKKLMRREPGTGVWSGV